MSTAEMVKKNLAYKLHRQEVAMSRFSWDICAIVAMWVTLAAAVAVKYL